MSDRQALKIFSRQAVSSEMVAFLAATTASIIQVKHTKAPFETMKQDSNVMVSHISKKSVPLELFIKRLIKHSNVQTPTLMASLVYLNKLRNLLPANAVGMETTRHRIFLSALILSAKSLNDSSPLNKHWTKYTEGLLTNEEVNMAERELAALLKWNVNIKEDELVSALQPFLIPIKQSLAKQMEQEMNEKVRLYRLHNAYSSNSLASRSTSASSISTYDSSYSLGTSNSSYSLKSTSSSHNLFKTAREKPSRNPLVPVSLSSLNVDNKPNLHKHNRYEDKYRRTDELVSADRVLI